MFNKLNWLPFKELIKYKQACLIYKSKADQAPSYIQDLFTNVTDCVSYSLRSSHQNCTFQEHILNPCHPQVLTRVGVNYNCN